MSASYSDRLVRQLPDLSRLTVLALEKHDLALSKTVRGSEHDFQQLRELHRIQGLDFDTLLSRYVDEMGHAIGDPRHRRMSFLSLLEDLFGELKRHEAERYMEDNPAE